MVDPLLIEAKLILISRTVWSVPDLPYWAVYDGVLNTV